MSHPWPWIHFRRRTTLQRTLGLRPCCTSRSCPDSAHCTTAWRKRCCRRKRRPSSHTDGSTSSEQKNNDFCGSSNQNSIFNQKMYLFCFKKHQIARPSSVPKESVRLPPLCFFANKSGNDLGEGGPGRFGRTPSGFRSPHCGAKFFVTIGSLYSVLRVLGKSIESIQKNVGLICPALEKILKHPWNKWHPRWIFMDNNQLYWIATVCLFKVWKQ